MASHFVGASGRVAIEHVTEKVRSVAVGDTELVGQVRNLGEIPTVVVDSDLSKSAEDLLLWEWLYDVEIEEEYRDSKDDNKLGGIGEQSTPMPEDCLSCCTTVPAALLSRLTHFLGNHWAAHDNVVL